MDLFSLIIDYLYEYIFYPINFAFEDHFSVGNPLNAVFYWDNGKFNFAQSYQSIDGYPLYSVPIYNSEGVHIYDVFGFSVMDALAFLTTLTIFILLFIVCVKFIVWLFKQISFVTRF